MPKYARKRVNRKRGPGGRRRVYRLRKLYKKKLRPMYKSINYPLATSVVKRLKYVERIGINPALTGALSSYTFSANAMFDPNVSGTGHQPYGFDQLMALYNHYQVIGSKIRITVTGQPNESFIYGLQLNDATIMSSTNVEAICEQPFAKRKIVSPGTSDTKDLTMSQGFSLRKFFGSKSNVNTLIGNRSYMGQVNTDPAEQAYYVLWCASNGPTSDPGLIQFHVEIEYLARFSEPKDLPMS